MDITPNSQAAPAAATPDPVTLISALLDAEKVTPDSKPAEPKPDAAQPEGDAKPGDNAQVEGGDAQPDKDAKTAEIPIDQLEAIELETTYKSDDGKDVTEKLPIKELRLGYMRQKDYGRKTAEIARQRAELANSVRQGIESERTQYVNTLQQMQTTLTELVAPELKDVNWNDLAANNQYEYIRLSNRRDQVNQALQGIVAKQQEVRAKADADRSQAAKATAQKTWATLEADIPGWNDQLYQEALKAGESVGFQPGEVGQWLDPRAVKLLHKAYLYDQLKVGKPPTDKKVVVAPAATKPGASVPVSKTAQKTGEALGQLRKSGRVDDLAAVIASMG